MTTFLVWIIGTVLFYAADGYFKFPFRIKESPTFYSANLILLAAPFWPITIWVVLAHKMREVAEKARDAKEQKFKIRIAEMKETAELLEMGEAETKKFLESVSRKTR